MKKITAIDALTVEFQLCSPDASFLPKVAFSVFGIQDSDYLTAHVPDGSILAKPNGTGPYKFKEWSKGNRIVWEANPDYWGDKAKTPTSSSTGATSRPPACSTCSPAPSTASTTPAPRTSRRSRATRPSKFYPRAGLNTLFLGFNNTQKPFDDVRVRQAIAMGIDRDQIVKNFYPDGSTVAEYFTPCEIAFACNGDKTWTFDPAGGQDSSSPTPASRTARASMSTSTSGRPSAATTRTRRSSPPRSPSSSRRTSASTRPRSSSSRPP